MKDTLYLMKTYHCPDCTAILNFVQLHDYDIGIKYLGVDFLYEEIIANFGHGSGLPVAEIDGVKVHGAINIARHLRTKYQ